MDKSAKSVWSASTWNVPTDYKPGGTGIITFGKTARRIINQGIDDLGRWSWMIYKREANIVVFVVSIYQCCKLPTNKTGITTYHQQQTILSERNKVDHDPR